MTAIGSWVLQQAIVTALRADVAIAALVTGVYDEVPQGASGDYIVVGEGIESDDSFFGQRGHAVRTAIEVWTPDGAASSLTTGAAGYKRALAIAELIVESIEYTGLTVTGHDVVVIRLDALEGRRFTEEPPQRAVVPEFLITLEDAE